MKNFEDIDTKVLTWCPLFKKGEYEMNRKNNLWGFLFISPQLIGLLAFSLIPLIYALWLSFTDWDGFGDLNFIGITNYVEQFYNADFWKAMVNTIYYMIMVVPIGISISLLLAVALNKVIAKNLYRVFFFMPVVTSSVSVGIIFMWLLNGDFGILNQMLAKIGIEGPHWLTDPRWVMPQLLY